MIVHMNNPGLAVNNAFMYNILRTRISPGLHSYANYSVPIRYLEDLRWEPFSSHAGVSVGVETSIRHIKQPPPLMFHGCTAVKTPLPSPSRFPSYPHPAAVSASSAKGFSISVSSPYLDKARPRLGTSDWLTSSGVLPISLLPSCFRFSSGGFRG